VLALDEVLAGTEKLLRRLIAEDIEISSSTEPNLGSVKAAGAGRSGSRQPGGQRP
jgi:hypothetical protein